MTHSNDRNRAPVHALLALAGLMLPPGAAGADTRTIVSWGGACERSQQQAYDEPYTQRTGTEIVQVSKPANSLAERFNAWLALPAWFRGAGRRPLPPGTAAGPSTAKWPTIAERRTRRRGHAGQA